MGIRIHKSLGYGLDLTKIKNPNLDKVTDWDYKENEQAFLDWKKEVLDWADRNNDIVEQITVKGHKGSRDFYQMINYDDESGDKNFIQFVPLGCEHWSRYNDNIDYVEYYMENGYDNGLEPVIKWFKGTLYPYVDLMRRNDTKDIGLEKYRESCYSNLQNYDPENYIPLVPFHLYFLIKRLEIVPEYELPDLYMKLRPSIYTYWA